MVVVSFGFVAGSPKKMKAENSEEDEEASKCKCYPFMIN